MSGYVDVPALQEALEEALTDANRLEAERDRLAAECAFMMRVFRVEDIHDETQIQPAVAVMLAAREVARVWCEVAVPYTGWDDRFSDAEAAYRAAVERAGE
jgi:hypothetical protein